MKIIQYDDGLRPIYRQCIHHVIEKKPKEIEHVLIEKAEIEARCDDYRGVSNVLRVQEACKNPDMLWLDSDILVKKWPDFEFKPGKPYFAHGLSGNPENWIFYVNGRCDYFQSLMDRYIENKGWTDLYWMARMIQANPKEVELFPRGYFIHLYLSRAVKSGKHFSNYGNNNYNVYRDPETDELKLDIRMK